MSRAISAAFFLVLMVVIIPIAANAEETWPQIAQKDLTQMEAAEALRFEIGVSQAYLTILAEDFDDRAYETALDVAKQISVEFQDRVVVAKVPDAPLQSHLPSGWGDSCIIVMTKDIEEENFVLCTYGLNVPTSTYNVDHKSLGERVLRDARSVQKSDYNPEAYSAAE